MTDVDIVKKKVGRPPKCMFCRMVYDNSQTMSSKRENHTIVERGVGVALIRGADENGKLFFIAAGDDYSDRYYPKFCPECGRKLVDTKPSNKKSKTKRKKR